MIRRAVTDTEKGMGSYDAEITEEAVDFLADMSEGDARHALNAVELGILSTERNPETGKIVIDLPVAEECIQRRSIRYDKDGDNHYDIISAFIKSMRGSDPDAAVYYLAKMLYAGESVTFIARRIMICASEDVGNADPQYRWQPHVHRQWNVLVCQRRRSYWRRRQPMWHVHRRAMR